MTALVCPCSCLLPTLSKTILPLVVSGSSELPPGLPATLVVRRSVPPCADAPSLLLLLFPESVLAPGEPY